MNVNPIRSNPQIAKIVSNPIQKSVPTDGAKPMRAADKLELSGLGHLVKAMKSNDVRTEKVASIKAALEAGTYNEDQKLDSILDKVLDDLAK